MLQIGTTMRSHCLGTGEICDVIQCSDEPRYQLQYMWSESRQEYLMITQGTIEDLESCGWSALC